MNLELINRKIKEVSNSYWQLYVPTIEWLMGSIANMKYQLELEGEKGNQSLIDKIAQYEALLEIMKDAEILEQKINEELTGTTSQTITDQIVKGFANGKSAVSDFTDTIEELIKGALINSFKRQWLETQLQEFYKAFAVDVQSGGGLTPDEILKNKSDLEKIIIDANAGFKAYSDLLTSMGGSFSEGLASQGGLSGAIKGITEDTANVLAGQFMGMRVDISKQTQMATESLNHLANIDYNTSVLHEMRDALNIIKLVKGSTDNSDTAFRAIGITK